ncbi:MAG: hypothetical protein ABR579_10040 [Actinomycetota bacterium]
MTQRRIVSGRAPAAIAAIAAALLMVGCGSGGGTTSGTSGDGQAAPAPRPSSPAQISIVTPTNGQVVKGPTVPLRIELTGAKIVQAMKMNKTMNISPTKGHIHVQLDGKLVSMNFSLHQALHDVAPGTHTLHVEFVASDHQPFDPRVFQEIAFTVKK